MTGSVNGRLLGAFDPPPPSSSLLRSHKRNALYAPPPSRALLERGLAQAHADLAEAGRALLASARETRWGRFSDFALLQRYRHEQERVRDLTDELSGRRAVPA